MRLATGFAIALVCAACGGRQEAAPRAARAAARPAPARPPDPPASPEGAAAEPAPASAAAPAQPVFVPTGTDQVFMRRVLDVIDQVALVMEQQQSSCDRMAAGLEVIAERNQDLLALGKQMKGNPARDRWMQEQAMPRLEKALPRMMAGFQKCQNDPRMQALMRRLGA